MGKNQLETYREAEMQSASPVELVIMLYDVLVRDINRVMDAIQKDDIEDRVKQSNHAFQVLQQLEDMLDMENGGSTAEDLSRVYSHIRAKVMEAQFRLDKTILRRQVEMILQLREGWQRATSAALSQTEETMVHAGGAANPYASPGEEVRCCGWSA
jgi:flagellar protein FliS